MAPVALRHRPKHRKIARTIEQAKEPLDGFEQVVIDVAHTNAHRFRQVTMVIGEKLYE
jgi:hypothetical protein